MPNDDAGWGSLDEGPPHAAESVDNQPDARSFGHGPDDLPFDDRPPFDGDTPAEYLSDDRGWEPGGPWDDVPPEYAGGDAGPDRARTSRPRRRKGEPDPIEGLEDIVHDSLQQILASLNKQPTADCMATIQSVVADAKVTAQLSDELREVYTGVFEVLTHECINNPSGTLNVQFCPVAREYSDAVRDELAVIARRAGDVDTGQAAGLWSALRESVQRQYSRDAILQFLALHKAKAPVEKLVDAHKRVVMEPPTARKALSNTKPVMTAREVAAEHKALIAAKPKMRFSSGFRTLDMAFTGRDEPMGFLAPGEQAVIAGMTGTGKSSFSYGLMAGLAQDLVNWGYPDGKVVWAHTEEESSDKIFAADFCEGQDFYHLADNVVVEAVGTSRKRLVEVMYILTQEADRLARETGRDITQFLPHILVLDYIQSLTSEKATDPVKESITSAELLLRGFQAWNFEEMAKWGEVSYQEYTGEPVPAGMTHHRVAVVTFAQLNKQDDNKMSFKARSKDHPLTDFTLEDGSPVPGWIDDKWGTGQPWAWEVREGDQRILRQNAISGSSVILKNATIILFLHRSKPYNNPEAIDPVTGEKTGHLEDVRARLIPDKTRNGSALKYVGMSFDIDRKGFRARYFDHRAEKAIAQGRIKPGSGMDTSWRKLGDPILPVRPKERPLAGVSY